MLLYFIRALFIVVIASFLFVSIFITPTESETEIVALFIRVVAGMGIAAIVIAIDWLTPKKSLNALAGIFFGNPNSPVIALRVYNDDLKAAMLRRKYRI